MDTATGEVTELLQTLIRNACVNDGTSGSGGEGRNADVIRAALGDHTAMQTYEPTPGRVSVLGKIEGSDPTAPSLCLMGHTDVVPVNPDGWSRDPFGGELVDGWVWGRGAVDMLNTTSAMTIAFQRLVASGFRPRGTLSLLAVADEEALGVHGAKWLTENAREDVACDYVVTEFGGFPMALPGAPEPVYPIMVAEKGTYWLHIRVRGTPGHASVPYRSDNALVTAAEVVTRLAAWQPRANLHETWQRFVAAAGFPDEIATALLDPDAVEDVCAALPLGVAKMLHACTHTTVAPTVLHGGVKTNIIPDTVDLQVDIRTLPGQTGEEIRAEIREVLGADLFARIEIAAESDMMASASPSDTPLYETLAAVTRDLVPGARTAPFLIVGATDARYFRRIGTHAYGYGLLSDKVAFDEFTQMFHGNDERIDVGSLALSAQLFETVARTFLG